MARIVGLLLLACVVMAVAVAGCLGGDDKKKVKAAVDDAAADDDSLLPDDIDAAAPDAEIPAAPAVLIFWVNYTEAPAASAEEAPEEEPEDVGPVGIETDSECGLAGTGLGLRVLGIRLGACE